jgi:uncharacterized protein
MTLVATGINLLVLQASPFCNINCDYCYLPDRGNKARMSLEVVQAAVKRVYAAELVRDRLCIVWHAGEPLAVPLAWYRQAFDIIHGIPPPPGADVVHSFQSNGTLLDAQWCEFFRDSEHRVSIGLSIDGPAELHDARRKTRSGRGTHAATMRGANLLREHGVPFHAIAVVTAAALDQPDAIYEFFTALGVTLVGFNIEELEGEHRRSSLDLGRHAERVRAFFRRIFELHAKSGGRMRIREFDHALALLRRPPPDSATSPWWNEQVRPFGIVSVDYQGRFATFSPELLGMTLPGIGDFSFGNVLEDDLIDALEHATFRRVFGDISRGLETCAATCPYFPQCGGGAPANKFYENGTFASAETMYCRFSIQLPLDIVLANLETLPAPPAPL